MTLWLGEAAIDLAHRMVELQARAPADVGGVAAGAVELVARAAGFLDCVHRGVGVAHQLVEAGAVAGVQHDADAAGDGEAQAHVAERPLQGLMHAARGDFGAMCVGMVDQQREFIAIEPGHRVDLAQAVREPCGDIDQHLVAAAVAERVVDVLEAVDVDMQQRERRAVALRERHREVDPVGKHTAVRQPGEHVAVGECVDAAHRLDPLGDVAERIDAADRLAAASLRQAHALEHAAGVEREGVGGTAGLGIVEGRQAPHVGRRVADAASRARRAAPTGSRRSG